MRPEEKAKELFDKFDIIISTDDPCWKSECKQCAMVVVDEILNSIVPKNEDERLVYELSGNQFYWKDVKKELEKL